jgi:hypothetical protein
VLTLLFLDQLVLREQMELTVQMEPLVRRDLRATLDLLAHRVTLDQLDLLEHRHHSLITRQTQTELFQLQADTLPGTLSVR